jgi:diguanylate cyclase (GGDEF)-like protein
MNSLPDSARTPRALGRKVALTTFMTAFAALCVAGVAMIVFQYVALRDGLVEDIRVQARIIGNNSSAAVLFRDARAGEEMLAGLAASPSVASAAIFDARMAALARFQRPAVAPLAPPITPTGSSWEARSFSHVEVAEPVVINNGPIGTVMIRASLDHVYSRLMAYAVLMLVVALGSLALAYALVASMRRAVRRAESHLHHLAHVDPVTQLPNRHQFNERLTLSLERADQYNTSLALLLLDLDNFKVVNDTLGHDAGDVLLKLVARRLVATLRSSDVICRMGGDEFVIIIEPTEGSGEVDSVARKILAAMTEPFDVNGHQLYASTSIGVSMYPHDATDARTLTRSADTAMYHAKARGKNGYELFQPDMDARAQKRMKVEANLRRALAAGTLELHYQPQVDARTGRIIGVEALARWNCPELGPVSPADFIPVAEESGIIVALGRWVLQTACRQAAAWRDQGLLEGIEHVAVNLSARQTRDPALMADIIDVLAETGLPARLLELEITEGVLMENVHANLALMKNLQDAGIHLSIDDFGTGYSSMSYLKRFPIDQLKIDRSFVHDVPGDGEAIATAVIAMAHSLGLSVVAEGVENAGQAEFLRRSGCDILQGYHFARPMAVAELTRLLEKAKLGEQAPA